MPLCFERNVYYRGSTMSLPLENVTDEQTPIITTVKMMGMSDYRSKCQEYLTIEKEFKGKVRHTRKPRGIDAPYP